MNIKLLKVVAVAAAATVIAGCGKMDSAQLSEKVKGEMQQEMVKKTGLKNLVMEDVRLVQEMKDGNVYSGIGTGKVNGNPVRFDVKCKYDGVSILWDAELKGDSMAALAFRETSDESVQAIKDAWPAFKESIKSNYNAAAEATRRTCDSAARKASEFYDEAKANFSSSAPATPAPDPQPQH